MVPSDLFVLHPVPCQRQSGNMPRSSARLSASSGGCGSFIKSCWVGISPCRRITSHSNSSWNPSAGCRWQGPRGYNDGVCSLRPTATIYNSGAPGSMPTATVSRACRARRAHLRLNQPIGLMCVHRVNSRVGRSRSSKWLWNQPTIQGSPVSFGRSLRGIGAICLRHLDFSHSHLECQSCRWPNGALCGG